MRDVMHLIEKPVRVNAILPHEPSQRCAVIIQESALQLIGRVAIKTGFVHDELRDPRIDQGEEIGLGRIEGIVEIEDPGVDVK